MRARSSDPKTKMMKLRLDCLRAAQDMLPHKTSAEEVKKLGRELYRWVSSDRPRPRRKLQGRLMRQLIREAANPAKGVCSTTTFRTAAELVREGKRAKQQRQSAPRRAVTTAGNPPVRQNPPEP